VVKAAAFTRGLAKKAVAAVTHAAEVVAKKVGEVATSIKEGVEKAVNAVGGFVKYLPWIAAGVAGVVIIGFVGSSM